MSSLMQVQKENSPKTARTRPAALEEAPKRKKAGTDNAKTARPAKSEPEASHRDKQRSFDVFAKVRSIIHTEISLLACTKTVLQK